MKGAACFYRLKRRKRVCADCYFLVRCKYLVLVENRRRAESNKVELRWNNSLVSDTVKCYLLLKWSSQQTGSFGDVCINNVTTAVLVKLYMKARHLTLWSIEVMWCWRFMFVDSVLLNTGSCRVQDDVEWDIAYVDRCSELVICVELSGHFVEREWVSWMCIIWNCVSVLQF